MNKKGAATLMVLLFIGNVIFTYFVTSSVQTTQSTIYESEESISKMQENVGSTIKTYDELNDVLKRSVETAILEVAWCGGNTTCGVDNPRLWWKGTLTENSNGNIPTLEDLTNTFEKRQKQKFLNITNVFLPNNIYKNYEDAKYTATYAVKYGEFYVNAREYFLSFAFSISVNLFASIVIPNGFSSIIVNTLKDMYINRFSKEKPIIDTINVTVSPKELLTFKEGDSDITINGTLRYDDHLTEFFNLFVLLNKTANEEDLSPNKDIYNNLTDLFKGKYCDDCTLHYSNASEARQYDFCQNASDKDYTEAGCIGNKEIFPLYNPSNSDKGAKNFSELAKDNNFLEKSGIDNNSLTNIKCYKDGDEGDKNYDPKDINKSDQNALPISKVTVVEVVNNALDDYEKKMQDVVSLNNKYNRNWTIKIVNRQINLEVKHKLIQKNLDATVCDTCSITDGNDMCKVTSNSLSSALYPDCNQEAANKQPLIKLICTFFTNFWGFLPYSFLWNSTFDTCNKTLYDNVTNECKIKVNNAISSDGSDGSPVCDGKNNADCYIIKWTCDNYTTPYGRCNTNPPSNLKATKECTGTSKCEETKRFSATGRKAVDDGDVTCPENTFHQTPCSPGQVGSCGYTTTSYVKKGKKYSCEDFKEYANFLSYVVCEGDLVPDTILGYSIYWPNCDGSGNTCYPYSHFFNESEVSYTSKPVHLKDNYTVYTDQYIYHVYINYTLELTDANEQYFAGSAKTPLVWRYKVEINHSFNQPCDPKNSDVIVDTPEVSCKKVDQSISSDVCPNDVCTYCKDVFTLRIGKGSASLKKGDFPNEWCETICPNGCINFGVLGAHCLNSANSNSVSINNNLNSNNQYVEISYYDPIVNAACSKSSSVTLQDVCTKTCKCTPSSPTNTCVCYCPSYCNKYGDGAKDKEDCNGTISGYETKKTDSVVDNDLHCS